jgi:hypothetical protein
MVRAEDSFSRFTTDSRCAGPGLFRLGALRPAGWLRRQLEIQAQGLCGHLDEFWPDVRDSGWIGGEAEGWERAPYWLDGLIPLAFLLEDERLIAKVDRWMDHILAAQGEDGWLGPQQQEQQGYHSARDPWPLFVMLKAMTQFAEAREEDASGARCFVAIGKALHAIASLLDKRPLFDWNQYRWADLLLTIRWYLARREDALVAELAERIHHQGYDWETHFARFVWTGKSRHWTFDRHVVNNAMGLKAPGAVAAAHRGTRRCGAALRPDRRAGSTSWSAHGHVQWGRVSRGTQPVAGHGALRRGGVSVLAGAALALYRGCSTERALRAHRVQRAAGTVHGRYVGAPVRSAGQSGAVHDRGGARLYDESCRRQSLRSRTGLWLLHGKHASGLPQALQFALVPGRGRIDSRTELRAL